MTELSSHQKISTKKFRTILTVLGVIGLLASLVLSFEKYQVALDPSHTPSCSLNPIVACESVLASGTDSLLLNIPNSFIGIGLFAALTTIGVLMFAGATMKAWFWKMFYAGVTFGVGMVVFFLTQSLYSIGSVCLYCMTIWAVILALFVYSTIWLVQQEILRVPKFLNKAWPTISKNPLGIVLALYLIIFGLILFRFRDYFESIWF